MARLRTWMVITAASMGAFYLVTSPLATKFVGYRLQDTVSAWMAGSVWVSGLGSTWVAVGKTKNMVLTNLRGRFRPSRVTKTDT